MINYPNGTKKAQVVNQEIKQKGYANRGMTLESHLKVVNDYYINNNIAIVYKKPTPIKVVHIKNEKPRYQIDDAYFLEPSTTDYNGIYKGKYLDFEAKETKNKNSFPLANVHPNQFLHLRRIKEHGGIGFFIISFTTLDKTFLVDASVLLNYYDAKKASIPLSVIESEGHLIPHSYPLLYDYIKIVDKVYF